MFRLSLNTANALIFAVGSSNIVKTIEYASRTCYDSYDKINDESWKSHISARVKSGHESVIEHGMLSIIITTDKLLDDINIIENALVTSNSLLHYINERGDLLIDNNRIISISGNIKMWRDFIKYLIRDYKEYSHLLDYIIRVFYCYNTSYDNIFIGDIPELNKYSTYNMNELLPSKYDYIDHDYGKIRHIDIDKIKELTPVNIYNNNGIIVDILNMDNFAKAFLFNTVHVPGYVKSFIFDHTKDLNSITYKIIIPRIISQQEARHRINSISQRSQRYISESNNDFYVPMEIFPLDKYYINDKPYTYNDMVNLIQEFYKVLLTSGIKKESARMILPGCINTTMIVTKPFYTLDHYFKERCSSAAQKEIREPAKAIREYINNNFTHIDNTGLFK